MAKVAKKVVKKRREKKNIERGAAHISATFNNTIVTITDTHGNAVSWASAGEMGFKGSRKSTPFAAQSASEAAAKKAVDHGMRFTLRDPDRDVSPQSARFRRQVWTSALSRM